MGNVIVVGSINVDFIVRVRNLPGPGETVAGGTFHRAGGGKGANQAVAAVRCGATALLIAAVGDDDLGRESLAELAREGADVSGCMRMASTHTGVAMIVVDVHGENQIAVASGSNDRLDEAVVEGALGGIEARPEGVVLAGFEVPDAAILAAARWAASRGLRTIVNPAPARPLPDGLWAFHPILTPNAREAAQLTGDADPERAATALHRRTGAPVIVTLGAEGALLLSPGPASAAGSVTIGRYAAPRVEALDSTGAGDAFNGILAAELASGADLGDAVRVAIAGASLSTRALGARAGLPTRAEIEAHLRPPSKTRLA